MGYVSIEDVQKKYDELLFWDKQTFLRNNLKDADVNDIIEYCEFPPEIELEPEPFDVLSSIDAEIIQEYLENIKKENNK